MPFDTIAHRQIWPTQVGGFLVGIGFLTGIANIAFFPSAICERGQAGNFVFAYLICVIVIGFPLTYLHLTLGIGWCWLILTVPMMVISNMNAAWSLYYMYISGKSVIFSSPLPWAAYEPIRYGRIGAPISLQNLSSISAATTTPNYFHHLYHTSAPKIVMSIDDDLILRVVDKKIVLGNIEWRLVFCLAISWLVVSLCTIQNSVNTMNRVVYVTATLPLLILSVLLARVLCLPGALNGIQLLYPNTALLTDLTVWQNAVKLVFFHMQIGVGIFISISKHNRFHTNVFRDAIHVVVINIVVSVCASCVAFGFLGFLAFRLNYPNVTKMCRGQIAPHVLWDQVLRSMAYLPGGEGGPFCILYQLMLSLGALQCSFTLCECFASCIEVRIQILKHRRSLLRTVVAILMFTLTLPCCYQGGVYVYNLLVHYSMHWNVKMIAICQFVAVSYCYGTNNLMRDLELMLRLRHDGKLSHFRRVFGPTGAYIRLSWTCFCPLAISAALCLDIIHNSDQKSRMTGDSALWHVLSISTVVPLPVMVFYRLYLKDRNAFSASGWREIGVPYDDSTISSSLPSSALTNQIIAARDTIAASGNLTSIGKESPLKCPAPSTTVEFIVNEAPYMRKLMPLTALQIEDTTSLSSTYSLDETLPADYDNQRSPHLPLYDTESVGLLSEANARNEVPVSLPRVYSLTVWNNLTGQPQFN